MAQKPKTRGSPGKDKREKEKTEKTQSERFIEAAREIGVDETGKEFERAINQLAPAQRNRKSS